MRDVPGSEKPEQRVEARFDGVASALRVPGGRALGKSKGGGSSKQYLLIEHGGRTRMRAIQPREAARLMGLPDSYILPAKPVDALSLCGDGVVVPVVHHLARWVFEPLLDRAVAKASTASQTAAVEAGQAMPRRPLRREI